MLSIFEKNMPSSAYLKSNSSKHWSNNLMEVSRISATSSKLANLKLIHITLDSGLEFEGVIRSQATGSNASTLKEDGRWRYYGHFEIESLERVIFNIDMISVHIISNIWHQKHHEFEIAGLLPFSKSETMINMLPKKNKQLTYQN